MDDNIAAVSGTRRSYKELVDGTLRVQIDIDPNFKNDFLKLFPEIDMPLAVTPLNVSHEPPTTYGNYAKVLRLSKFLTELPVLQALGSDDEYRAWIQICDCIVCSKRDYIEQIGEMKSEAAHVRRADKFGMAHKAEYSCVPLCHKHHGLQHLKGEAMIGGRVFVEKECERLLREWAWQALKIHLNVSSMKHASPQEVRAWAERHNIEQYLP